MCIDPTLALLFLDYLIDNIYVEFGKTLHEQTIGIPMGMCCALLLANLCLMSYEYRFMESLERKINSMQNYLILPFDILMTLSV